VPIILKLFIWYLLFSNYSGNNLPRPSADHNYNEVYTDNSYHANLHFSWHVHSKSCGYSTHTLAKLKVSWNTLAILYLIHIPYMHRIVSVLLFFSFVTPTAKQGLDIGTSRGKQKHIHPSQLNASLVLSRSMWNIVDHTLPIPPCSITPAWGHPYNPRLL